MTEHAEPDVTEKAVSSTAAQQDQKPQDAEDEYLHGLRLSLLITGLILAVLIMALDISIVATAIPRITDTFHTITDIGWYGAAFTFTNSALQPMAGKIYSFFPIKWSFVGFIVVFELGSLLCATATSSAMFIVGRAVAGMGSSGIVNGALSILALAGPPDTRPMWMGIIMSVAGAGQLIGPLIGGALTQNATWRWCFYINLPIGGVTLLFLALITFPSDKDRRKTFVPRSMIQDFDIVGFLLFVPAILMLMMALQWGGTIYAWNSATTIGLLAGAIVTLFIFGFWEHRHGSNAMFPGSILRIRVIYCACITGFMAGAAVLVISYYLPLWFQTVKLASPLKSAVDTLPSFLSQILLAIVVGTLCPRVIPYLTPFAIGGGILSTIGLGLMSTFRVNTGTAAWIGYQILSGGGRGMLMQIPVQITQQHISKQDLAVGTAVVSFFQFFGGSIFLAFAQTAFSNLLKTSLHRYAPGVNPEVVLESGATDIRAVVSAADLGGVIKAYSQAISKTFYVGVGAAAVSAISALGLGWKPVEKKVKKVKKEENAGHSEQQV